MNRQPLYMFRLLLIAIFTEYQFVGNEHTDVYQLHEGCTTLNSLSIKTPDDGFLKSPKHVALSHSVMFTNRLNL